MSCIIKFYYTLFIWRCVLSVCQKGRAMVVILFYVFSISTWNNAVACTSYLIKVDGCTGYTQHVNVWKNALSSNLCSLFQEALLRGEDASGIKYAVEALRNSLPGLSPSRRSLLEREIRVFLLCKIMFNC